MGSKQRPEGTCKQELKDFLYRDLARISSFFAQINRGDLLEVVKSQSETVDRRNGLEIGAPNVIRGSKGTEATTSNALDSRFNPGDSKIIDLLESIMPAHEPDDIESVSNGQIIHLTGSLFIRDFSIIKTALPEILNADPTIFGSKNSPTKKRKHGETPEDKQMKAFLKMIPMGIDMEFISLNGITVTGILKPEYLSETPEDLMRSYGSVIPGTWHVVGIASIPDSNASSNSSSMMNQAIDSMTSVIASALYSERHSLVLTPILLYRTINLGQVHQ